MKPQDDVSASTGSGDAEPQPSEFGRRLALGVVVWWVIVCWAIGLVLTGSELWQNIRQHEPWLLLGICVGDLCAAYWFIHFFTNHFLFGDPLLDRPAEPGRTRTLRRAALTLILGFVLHIGFGIYVFQHQRSA